MVIARRTVSAVFAGSVLFVACQPTFSDRTSEVENYRVLAIQAEPAEWERVINPDTNQATPAKYSALVVDPLGTVANAALQWAFCTLPKPLTELNDVSIACFQNDPSFIVPLGTGPAASGAIPENTCRQFGPEVPENTAYRPADPDVTGGYYQPIRVLYQPTPTDTVPTIAKVRIHCGLAGASQDQTSEYNRNYHLNTNPVLDSVLANGQPVTTIEKDPNAAPLAVGRGVKITLRVTWPACPLTDVCGDGTCGPTETKETGIGQCTDDCATETACGGAERYLAFDLESRTLQTQRELMRVSWYAPANGPSFADDRTGRDGTDPATFSDNVLTAPSTPGTYPVWVVLRDGRGGLTWASFRIVVT